MRAFCLLLVVLAVLVAVAGFRAAFVALAGTVIAMAALWIAYEAWAAFVEWVISK